MKNLYIVAFITLLVNASSLQLQAFKMSNYTPTSSTALLLTPVVVGYSSTQKFYCEQQKGMVFKDGMCMSKKRAEELKKQEEVIKYNEKQRKTVENTEKQPQEDQAALQPETISFTDEVSNLTQEPLNIRGNNPENYAQLSFESVSKPVSQPMFRNSSSAVRGTLFSNAQATTNENKLTKKNQNASSLNFNWFNS